MRNRNMRESTTTTASATVNYDLPQWNGEDVTSWMTNLNDAFNKIDSAMWANHTAMAGYDKITSDLQKLADGIKVDNAEIREALRIVQQGMADQLTQLNQAKTDITNANLAISQLQTEDNALSAMIEDLQDDVGILTRWNMNQHREELPEPFQFSDDYEIIALAISGKDLGIRIRTKREIALTSWNSVTQVTTDQAIISRIYDFIKRYFGKSGFEAVNCITHPAFLNNAKVACVMVLLRNELKIRTNTFNETTLPPNAEYEMWSTIMYGGD